MDTETTPDPTMLRRRNAILEMAEARMLPLWTGPGPRCVRRIRCMAVALAADLAVRDLERGAPGA